VANGWEQLMYDGTSANRYVFLRGPGLTGNDPVWVGLDTYQNIASEYYNIAVGVANGYLVSQNYYNQPQMKRIGVPLFYDRVDYWLHVNAQRIVFVCKVGQSYYEHGYMGKFIPYLSPTQYPYPAFVGGMFGYNSSSSTLMSVKYNSTSSYYEIPYIGNQYLSSSNCGYNGQVYSSFNNKWEACWKSCLGAGTMGITLNNQKPVYNIDIGIYYTSSPDTQRLVAGIYGCLDGVYMINPNYDEVYAEDVITIDDDSFIAFPSKNATSANVLIKTND